MNGPFSVRKHDEGDGVVRLAVHGEIDNDGCAMLGVIICNAIEQLGVQAVILDLERVSHLAAAGIRSLLECLQMAQQIGRSLHVVNAQDVVAGVLQASGVHGLLAPAPRAREFSRP